jgi:hypothetical protein
MKLFRFLSRKPKRGSNGLPEVAGMEIPKEKLKALQPSDQFLISYPRSGNTWTRYLLKDLIILGKPEISEEFHPDAIIPDIHHSPLDHLAQKKFGMTTRIFKSHNVRDVQGYRTVYLFRRAADALLSYYHFGVLKEQAWSIPGETPDEFCRRFLPTWQEHVEVMLAANQAAPGTVLFVAYEQLLENGLHELRRIADFYKLDVNDGLIASAYQRNTFDKLRAREEKRNAAPKGFFFRKGRAGSAGEELDEATVTFLEEATRDQYQAIFQLAKQSCPAS